MSSMRLDLVLRLIWLILLAHPLYTLANQLGPFHLAEALLAGFVCGLLALRERGTIRRVVKPPDTLAWRAHGFDATVPSRTPPTVRNPLVAGPLWLGALVLTQALWTGMAHPLLPVTRVEWVAIYGTIATCGLLATLFAHGYARRVRRTQVRLEGSLLTVGKTSVPLGGEVVCEVDDDRGRLRVRTTQAAVDIPGAPDELRWLAARIHEASRTDVDDRNAVPHALGRLRTARTDESRSTSR